MKFVSFILLATYLACAPAAFAKGSLPFTVLSAPIDAHMKPRPLPDFSLIERSGKKITLADLRGNVWIADFIYTHCTDTCPLQSADMAMLQERWTKEGELKLVSFSVNPERDTPRVLSEYASRFKADAKRWLFLTGDKKEIARLAKEGFRFAVAPARHGNHGIIMHSPRFVLVDRQGQIRGYYDNRDPKAMQRLENDVTRLLQHSPLAWGTPVGKF